ncbi:hypothetical protein [Algibacter sp. 2305UL17-15]|uniref:hypothetical protein n=1 Tax=Algibacter sp. 2305UL17-15 TaxID=3231268 RepID=UPI003458B789
MIKLVLAFSIVLLSFQALSQNKTFSKKYLKINIIDRGFLNPLHLTSTKESDYFIVKEGITASIVVIHNIGYDDQILDLKYINQRYLFLDYNKENTFSLNLIDIISKKKRKLYGGYCNVYHYVKDARFERNPKLHKDDPEEAIIETDMTRGMNGDEPWRLIKLNEWKVNNSVSQAIKNGRKLISSSKFNKDLDTAEEEKEKAIARSKIKAQKSKSGFLFYPDSFWQKTYSGKDGQVLKNCFNGNFGKILKSDVDRFLYEFLISYYESCGKSFSKSGAYLNSIYSERIYSSDPLSVDFADPYFYYRKEIKIPQKYADKFEQTRSFWTLEKDADKFYWNCHFFIKNARCNSSELNQLIENISRLVFGKPSLQNENK